MCSIPLVLFTAYTAMSAYSGVQQAQAQEEEGQARGQYYDYLAENSRLQGKAIVERAERQSEIVQDVAKEQGKHLKKTQAQLQASQQATLAAKGITGGVTAEDIAISTQDEQYLDELALRYNADMESWGVTTDASYKNWAAKTQATQYEYAGENAVYAGKYRARTTLLGTATSILGSAALFGAMGGFKNLFKPETVTTRILRTSSLAPVARQPAGALDYNPYSGKGFVSF